MRRRLLIPSSLSSGGYQFLSRSKSGLPSVSSDKSPDYVYERARHNANTFDTFYNLHGHSWRSRQIQQTNQYPMSPYPRLPPKRIHASPNYPSNFFPSYAHSGRVGPPSLPPNHVQIHDQQSSTKMRTAAKMARRLLDYACHPSVARVGTTTEQIDSLVHDTALSWSVYPSPLNYMGFPKSLCSSVNEVVCHGIPDTRPLKSGDVVSFDVSCFVNGVHGDNCATIVVGDLDDTTDIPENQTLSPLIKSASILHTPIEDDSSVSEWKSDWRSIPYKTNFNSDEEEERFITARRLVRAALESRDEGVRACMPGGCLSDIGRAIHAVSDAYGYNTVRHYRGHGISSDFHCAPFVKHYRNDDRMELVPGMIFTIEPMITEGTAECDEWPDNWTVATKDGGRAAQFEHTVLITETGVEILTLP